jgi:hypothetical protein
MIALRHTLNVLLFVSILSCGNGNLRKEKVRALDSIGGALGAVARQMDKADTNTLLRAVSRFSYYRLFIEKNINDTLTKKEGDQLQNFYRSGNVLSAYRSNRTLLLSQSAAVLSQISKLSHDADKGAISTADLDRYYGTESMAAKQLIMQMNAQQELLHGALQDFRNSLNTVEEVIRSHNHGELPTIIKDTLSF